MRAVWTLAVTGLLAAQLGADGGGSFRGEVVDAQTGKHLPVRVYVQSAEGKWHFLKSASPHGSAVEYRRERQAGSVEMHTTVSAHPFTADLPRGKYTLTIERGKEYLPVERPIEIQAEPANARIELSRWIDMAGRGWYSGDTHVHRTVEDLPNAVLAEDLNVALPLSYWVTTSHTAPRSGNKNTGTNLRPAPIAADSTHLIYPINTEYEIFTVNGKSHTLGAIFILGHKTPFDEGVPPVKPVAERARREGALLDLDKHSWPWSLALVPIMNVDLFELANNHVWRTQFGFRNWTIQTLPKYMGLETDAVGFTEWGWIDFGFQTYYALLNSNFRLRPSAGTASGVHPVPLGFGRVYVHLPEGFGYDAWMTGLNAGRSFVTTGPMLLVQFNGQDPGHTFAAQDRPTCTLSGSAESAVPLDRVEIVINGRVAKTLAPRNVKTAQGGYRSPLDETVAWEGSGWVAVRAFERRPDGRVRFAHTAPVHFDVPGKPLRPRPEEIDYLIRQVQIEIDRSAGVLTEAAIDEYREALRKYQDVKAGRTPPKS